MSELLGNALSRKELLKHMIGKLHEGQAPAQVRNQLIRVLGQIPYDEVVETEQELIREGLPVEEIQRLCDLHGAALNGVVDLTRARVAPPGHPVHTFQMENQALAAEIRELGQVLAQVRALPEDSPAEQFTIPIRVRVNALMDVEKHYLRKEYLLFPFLEKHGITGPPKVMWGKHDETRQLMGGAFEAMESAGEITAGELCGIADLALEPAATAILGMIDREEQILLPMSLDTLSDSEWLEISQQSLQYGFCLYDPEVEWKPEGIAPSASTGVQETDRVQFPTGSLSTKELQAILNTVPFDMTFVDSNDTVRYFTKGRERIFSRSRAILGRKVEYCHPPKSVHMVRQILEDFKSGAHDQAAFWIDMRGRFIHIEYFALRGEEGEYLGCLEVSQDLTSRRALTGERRLLTYTDGKDRERG